MAQRICIIGGGVIGLATAYAMVRDGFDVTLVEARDALGSETSARLLSELIGQRSTSIDMQGLAPHAA